LHKLISFVKTHFLTVKFLTFGTIGVLNTLIHMSVYWIFYNLLVVGPFFSNTVAFITASVFSYLANAFFTFKPKSKNFTQFGAVILVFSIRLLISNGLTSLFDYVMLSLLHADYALHAWMTFVAPFLASALLIPIAYFALDIVFKKTDIKNQ